MSLCYQNDRELIGDSHIAGVKNNKYKTLISLVTDVWMESSNMEIHLHYNIVDFFLLV